jgi:hypothetical protein
LYLDPDNRPTGIKEKGGIATLDLSKLKEFNVRRLNEHLRASPTVIHRINIVAFTGYICSPDSLNNLALLESEVSRDKMQVSFYSGVSCHDFL